MGPGGTSALDTYLYRSAAKTFTLGSTTSLSDGTLALATLTAGTQVSTPSITTTASGIAFNSKSLTGVNDVGATTATLVTSVTTPLITANGSSSLTVQSTGLSYSILYNSGSGIHDFQNQVIQNVNALKGGAVLPINGATPTASAGSFSVAIGSGTNTFSGAGNYNAIIACGNTGTTTMTSSGTNNLIAACNNTATISGGNASVILASNGSTISASSGANVIIGAGNGNSTISSTAGGSFIWGSYMTTTQSNVFALTDSSNTSIAIGTSKQMVARFTNGYTFYTNAGGTVGASMAASATSWSTVSDQRLKKISRELPASSVLEAISKLRVVNYNYHIDEEDYGPRIGMIAQEVNEVLEQLSLRKKNVIHGHTYHQKHPEEPPIEAISGDDITFLTLSAVQELKRRIEELERLIKK
jgi:hypothetical protein